MNTSTLHRLPWVLLLCSVLTLPLVSCIEDGDDDDSSPISDDDDSAAGDDDTGDDDTGDDDTGDDDTGDDDDSVASSAAPAGQALCAAGGRVSGEGLSGVVCLGPVDLASGERATSADGSLTWLPGPTSRIAP